MAPLEMFTHNRSTTGCCTQNEGGWLSQVGRKSIRSKLSWVFKADGASGAGLLGTTMAVRGSSRPTSRLAHTWKTVGPRMRELRTGTLQCQAPPTAMPRADGHLRAKQAFKSFHRAPAPPTHVPSLHVLNHPCPTAVRHSPILGDVVLQEAGRGAPRLGSLSEGCLPPSPPHPHRHTPPALPFKAPRPGALDSSRGRTAIYSSCSLWACLLDQ